MGEGLQGKPCEEGLRVFGFFGLEKRKPHRCLQFPHERQRRGQH